MSVRKRARVRPGATVAARERAVEQPAAPRPHPLLELQRSVGNQAVGRLLMRDALTTKERDEQWLRQHIADQDRAITRAFENIEYGLSVGEDRRRLPLVQGVKLVYRTTDILTHAMIDDLHRSILPVKFPSEFEMKFKTLHRELTLKEALVEGLDDPEKWADEKRDSWYRH